MCQEVWAWHSPVLLNPYDFGRGLDYRRSTDKDTGTQMLSKLLKVTYPGSSRVVAPTPFYYFIALLTPLAHPFSHFLSHTSFFE